MDKINSSTSTKDIDGVLEVNHGKRNEYLDVYMLNHNGKTIFLARTYIKNTIQRLERTRNKSFLQAKSPVVGNLHPKVNNLPFLDTEDHHRFRSMI